MSTVVIYQRQSANSGQRALGTVEVQREDGHFIEVRYRGDRRVFNKHSRRETAPRPSSRLGYCTLAEYHQDPQLYVRGRPLVNVSSRKRNST